MLLSFSGNLLPIPVSITTVCLPVRTTTVLVPSRIWFRSLAGMRFSHRGLGDYPEHGAAIQQIGAIGQNGQLKVAQRGVATHQIAGHCWPSRYPQWAA